MLYPSSGSVVMGVVFVSLLMVSFSAGAQSEITAGWLPGTYKVRKDEWPLDLMKPPIKIQAARNEYEPFQVIVRTGSQGVPNIKVAVTDLVSGSNILSRNYVEITTAHFIYTESQNPRYPSGWHPDALIPLEVSDTAVEPHSNASFWFTVYIPPDIPPGLYRGFVTFMSDGQLINRLPLQLEIWPFTLPVESHQASAFGLWLDQVADAHRMTRTDPAFYDLAWRYYWFLVDHRVMPRELPFPLYAPTTIPAVQNPKVSSFALEWPWGQEQAPGFERIVHTARQHGVIHKGYVYAVDEPEEADFDRVKAIHRAAREFGNDIPRVLTYYKDRRYGEIFDGYVEIWAANLEVFDPEFARQRHAKGEQIWWYTAIGPQAPYPTYLIDDDAIAHRVLSWLQVLYGVNGTLYWSATVFKKWNGEAYIPRDVWTDAMVAHSGYGDGFLVYPGMRYGIDGPIGTIRLSIIREGNEDLEYFWLYRELARQAQLDEADIEKKVSEILAPVVRSLTDWERDPVILYRQREALAREIIGVMETIDRND